MPRVVFQILWDYIQAGRPVVALVKNLARDGRYYWVVALVVAIPSGYLSVRFKPGSPLLATVEKLYAELLTLETSIEAGGNDRKAAIAASRQQLNTNLQALGFRDYDDFMQQALKLEMQNRATLCTFVSLTGVPEDANQPAALIFLNTSARLFDRLARLLNLLFDDLESYAAINKGVRAKSETVADTSESLRVSALNGVIAVDKLGVSAAGLRPVLGWLRGLSVEIMQEGLHLSTALDELVKDVDRVVFALTAAKLQVEMTAQFAHELLTKATANHAARAADTVDHMTEGAIGSLHASSCETIRRALSGLSSIQGRLQSLAESHMNLLKSSQSLRPVYLTGLIQLADVADSKLPAVFKNVGGQLEETAGNLSGLRGVLETLSAHLSQGLAHGREVEDVISQIDAHTEVHVRF